MADLRDTIAKFVHPRSVPQPLLAALDEVEKHGLTARAEALIPLSLVSVLACAGFQVGLELSLTDSALARYILTTIDSESVEVVADFQARGRVVTRGGDELPPNPNAEQIEIVRTQDAAELATELRQELGLPLVEA